MTKALLAALALVATSAFAQYPNKAVTIVVGFEPGGGTDTTARIVQGPLGELLGQQVVVENRAGAGGNLGAKQAAQAKNDGYTILMGAVTAHSIAQTLTPDTARYSLEKDFAPVSMLGNVPVMLVVNPNVPAKSLKEFVELVKQKPGQVTLSSAGIGTTQHLAAEKFALATGTKILHVPYKGSGPAITDLIGGQIVGTFETGPATMSFLKSGQLRALAIASKSRSSQLPDVPTMAEAGLPNYEVSGTYGILAPAGTPKPIIDRLNAEVKVALASPEVQAQLAEQGVIPTYTTPKETAAFIRAEIAKWAEVIKAGSVKPQ